MRRKNTFNSSSLTDSYRWFLEHLYDEHLKGHYLTAPQIQILEDHNYIKPLARPKKEKPIRLVGEGSRDFTISHPNEIPATQKTDITIIEDEQPFNTSVDNLEEQDSVDILTEEEHQVKAEKMVYEGRENIKQSDWLPEDLINHKQDFVDWINSITNGFKTKREYKKFNLYVQQANDWYAENKSEADFDSEEERIDYVKNEYTRCAQNTLYFANKYCYLQEPLLPNGRRKYYATDDYEHHKVLFYLFDCEYSLLIGKPRQGGFTSAFGICGVKRTLFRRNHYLKFITEDEMTGVEIFRDKFKYCFGEIPNMFKPNVANDAAKIFAVGHKNEKGDVSGINSRMEIVAPKRTAINGGSPSLVMIDEIDTIGILTEMINEGRPALFWKNPKKGNKLEMRRQLIGWGTGVIKKDGKGRGVFEAEWKRMSGLWRDGKYDAGIIPIFFDWTVRCTEAEYLQQKEYYFGVRASQEGISVETSKLQFGLHYPSTPEDMFYSNEKTVVPRDYVNNALDRIRNLDPLLKAEYGFFEPVLDNAGKIIDARFILCDEIDSRVTTVMFQRPKKGWINRYYQGTDPIGADTGHSKMASAIFDKQYCTVSAVVNYRAQGDASSSFMQCLLLGIYFDTEHHFGVPELLEKNIGLAYVQFLETQGFYNRLVFNSELQDYFQSGEKNAPGIDNKGNRNKLIIAKLQELINQYGHKIFIDVFFIQLKTFVCNITRSGNETWETIDKQYYFDDVLFAITFAYICSETYQFRLPKEIGNEMYEQKVTYEYAHDAHWNLVLRQKTLVEKVA